MRALVTAGAFLALAAPAAAVETGAYSGKTDGGYDVSFRVAGGKVRSLQATVPTTCLSTGDEAPRAGGELFEPPGAFAVGATRKVRAEQTPAMHYNDVTKHYTVTLKRTRAGLKAKLRLSFSFQSLDYSGDSPRLVGWVCQGDDSFSVR